MFSSSSDPIQNEWRSFLERIDACSNGQMIECIPPKNLIRGLRLSRSHYAAWNYEKLMRPLIEQREATYRQQAKLWCAFSKVYGRGSVPPSLYYDRNDPNYVRFILDKDASPDEGKYYAPEYSTGGISDTPMSAIAANPRADYNWGAICKRADFDPNIIRSYPHFMYSFKAISGNKKVTLDFVLEFIEKGWDWNVLSARADIINPDSLEEFPELLRDVRWKHMHKNPSLTEKFVEQHINEDWDFPELTSHPCLSLNFILKYASKGWNFKVLTKHRDMTLEYIRNHPHHDWDWPIIPVQFAADKEQVLEVADQFIDKEWDFTILSEFLYLTWDFVLRHMNKPWVKELLRQHSFEYQRNIKKQEA